MQMATTKRRRIGILAGLLAAAGVMLRTGAAEAARPAGKIDTDWGDRAGQACVDCHMTESPGLYLQWNDSKHGQNGVNCLDCHKAEPGDVDSYEHKDAPISVIVSPKDCSRCHPQQFAEVQRSHRASAREILASLDNLLGEVVGGPAAVNAGCRQCHGGKIDVYTSGKQKGQPGLMKVSQNGHI